MADADRSAFQKALSDFTFDVACGGAIRRLADSGYTWKQIMERLDYPVTEERVRNTLYRHLCDTGVILEKSPEEELPETKPEYVLEYDAYGKPSYRRKPEAGMGGNPPARGSVERWRERIYQPAAEAAGQSRKQSTGEGRGGELAACLARMGNHGNGQGVWISCDFGIPESPAARGIALQNERRQEYLRGIPWPRHRVYHRLDHRMREIICSLYEQGMYEGVCYFLSCREKLLIL